MPYTIRKAKPDDAEEFIRYLIQVGGESDNLTFGEEGMPFTVEQERKFLASLEKSDTCVIFCAVDGDRIIGDISCDRNPRERLRHRGNIGITVLKDYWHKGIGSELLKTTIEYAKNEMKLEVLTLDVRCDNTNAIKLYEKFGFKITGTLPAMMKIRGEYIDCYTMTLYL